MPSTTRSAIPYPAGSDSPNLPAQMQAIATAVEDQAKDDQGPYASRPVSTPSVPGISGRYYYATDRGVVYRDTGIGWIPAGGVERGSLLPTSAPADSTLFDLVVDEGQGIVWTFRYVSGLATYKWVFVGGPPFGFAESNSIVHTANTTSYTSLGGECAIPYRGVYEIEFGANAYTEFGHNDFDDGCAMSFTIPITGTDAPPSDNDCVMSQAVGTGVDTNVYYAHHHLRRITVKTATEAGKFFLFGKALGGGIASFRGMFMYVRPIQVMTP